MFYWWPHSYTISPLNSSWQLPVTMKLNSSIVKKKAYFGTKFQTNAPFALDLSTTANFLHLYASLEPWITHSKTRFVYCHQTSNISRTEFQNSNVFLVSSCSCLYSIHWKQVLSREWKCSWSSADRRCSNYIWVISKFIAYKGAPYIRELELELELIYFT